MKKTFFKILVLIMIACMLFTFVGCNVPNQGDGPGQVPDDGNGGNSGNGEGGGNSGDGSVVAKYNIYFYTGDKATQVDTMTGIEAGAKITKPNNPKRTGYNFGGWFTDYGTYQNEFTFDVMPANNITLYALWKEGIKQEAIEEYEKNLDANSKSGHLYIHYMRFDNDPDAYAKMSMWVWPKAYTGRTFNWDKDIYGNVVVDDIGGAVCDIDMTKIYNDAGNAENEHLQFFKDGYYGDNYKDEYALNIDTYLDSEIGFLIVYDESKNSGTHWTSDGGNQYFTIEKTIRSNGAIHIFATQDNVGDFVLKLADQTEISNPYENDDGTHVSISNVNSSADLGKVADPLDLFDTVSGVGYQIMVASFADSDGDGYGDIRGIINNLDYLEKLNVDVLWLTPIQYSDSYHGYDIIDYCAVDPKFGTIDDYKELLTKCHEKGMKVIMDLVLNHTSINNVWFQKSAKMVVEDGIDYRSFYHWRNHNTENLSSSWYQYSEYTYSYYAKFASGMPELNYDYQPTRDAILGVAEFWMTLLGEDEGVDGFRIDAVKHIYMADEVTAKSGDVIISDYDSATNTDYSSNVTKNINFFSWLISEAKKINPNLYMVGENFDGHAYRVAPYYQAFDGMLDFYMYYNLGQLAAGQEWGSGLAGENTSSDGSVPTGTNTNKLKGGAWSYLGVLNTEKKYGGEVSGSIFTSNHDLPRLMNNVVGTKQNGSDWVAGTVTNSNAETAKSRALTTIAAMMTLPGVSWIYYGDELGMSSNYGSGENKNSSHVDRQYRQPFKWTTSADDSTYTTNYSISGDKTYYVKWDTYNEKLPGATEQLADSDSFLNEVRKWTKLKSEDNVIRYGDYAFKKFGSSDMFAFTRTYEGVTYWVVCNFTSSEYAMARSVFGNAELICASSGASLEYIPAGGCVVAKISG